VADDKWSKYEVTAGTDKWDKYAQEDAAVPGAKFSMEGGKPSWQPGQPPEVPPAPNPIIGQTVSRNRMIPGPGGGFPQNYSMTQNQAEASQNLATGALGAAATGAGLLTAPAATIGSLIGGYATGKVAKAVTKKVGGGETAQDIAEAGGNVIGGVAGGVATGVIGAGINAGVRRMVAGKVWIQQPNGSWVADPWADALTFGTKIGKAILNHLAPKPAQDLAMADAYAATRAVQRQAARNALVSKTPLGPEAPPPAAPPEMFPGATPSNIPVGNAQLPPATQGAQQPPAFVSKFQPPQTPQPSKLVLPGSTPPPVKVTYQSVPRKKLYEMAQTGDIQAGLELIRNPKGFELPPNFKYLIEESAKKMPWRNQPE
jgi:hypothetical protein